MIVKGSSGAVESAESDKEAESLGSARMSPESPEGELLPRFSTKLKTNQTKIQTAEYTSPIQQNKHKAPVAPAKNLGQKSCKDVVGKENAIES